MIETKKTSEVHNPPLIGCSPVQTGTLLEPLFHLLTNNNPEQARSLRQRCQRLFNQGVPDQELVDHLNTCCTLEELEALEKLLKAEAGCLKLKTSPSLSSGATGTQGLINDVSMWIRSFPIPDSPVLSLGGMTTATNAWIGLLATVSAAVKLKKSMKHHDGPGAVAAALDTIGSVFQHLGGIFYFPFRGIEIASSIKHVDVSKEATTALGQTCYWTGFLGNVSLIAMSVFNFFQHIYRLGKDLQLKRALEAAESKGDEALFAFLLNKVEAHPENRVGKIQRLPSKERQSLSAQLKEEGLNYLTKQCLKFQKEGEAALSEKEIKGALKGLFALIDQQEQVGPLIENILRGMGDVDKERLIWLQMRIQRLGWGALELIGFQVEENLRAKRKKASFYRIVGQEPFEKIQKAARRGLLERLKSTNEGIQGSAKNEISLLTKEIKVANTTTSWIHGLSIVIAVLGLVVTVMGLCALNPVGTVALIVLGCLFAFTSTGVDGYSLKNALEKGPIGPHDKKFIIATGILSLSSLVISTALTAAFALPLLPMIVIFAISLSGYAISFYSYYQLTKKEEEWKNNHITLQDFSKESGEANRQVFILNQFKKLDKKDRESIRENYIETISWIQRAKVFESAMRTPKSKEVFKALKKTTHLFWKKAYQGGSAQVRETALYLQSLLENFQQANADTFQEALSFLWNLGSNYLFMNQIAYYQQRTKDPEFLRESAKKVLKERQDPNPYFQHV